MSTFTKTFLCTGVPLIALSGLSLGGTALSDLYAAWLFAALLWILVFVAAVVFAVTGDQDVAAGPFATFGVGFLALATTCFANLSTGLRIGVGG